MRRAFRFVLELVARAARAGALGVCALDHEIRYDAVENGPVVEWVFALLACGRVSPLALAFRQFDKVGDGFRSVLLKQTANDVAFAGVEDGVGARGACHIFPRVSGSRLLLRLRRL